MAVHKEMVDGDEVIPKSLLHRVIHFPVICAEYSAHFISLRLRGVGSLQFFAVQNMVSERGGC